MKYIFLTAGVFGSYKAVMAGFPLVLTLAAWGAIVAVLHDAVGRDKN